jgi:small subunit ribosomal protein S13
MIRISGVNLDDKKRIVVALTKIRGIGNTKSATILQKLSIDPNTRTKDIAADQEVALREEIEKQHRTEGELQHEIRMNIRRLRDIGCYRGVRHTRGLPVRGQRTKTNNRTVRGNKRMTAGSGRAKAASKT